MLPTCILTREKQRTSICLGHMATLGKAFNVYVNDYNGRFPGSAPLHMYPKGQYVWLAPDPTIAGSPYRNIYNKGALWPYVLDENAYKCPSDGSMIRTINGTQYEFGLSYSMNWHFPYISINDVVLPEETAMLICEGSDKYVEGSNRCIVDGNFGPGIDWPSDIHMGGHCLAYVDGHSAWIPHSQYNDVLWRYSGYN